MDPGGAPERFSKIHFFDSESALGAAPPSGPAGSLGVHPEITDGLMNPQGCVFGAGGGQPMHSRCPTMSIEAVVTRNQARIKYYLSESFF